MSGNFFNLEPMYLALADDVDLVITEMRNTTYRQPEWYRYVAAFAGDKDVVVVENPYGGVVPELIELLAEGKGHDLFRLSLYEAAALGANMSVPYGSWMGSVIEDSFYAPHELATEVQDFLADHEHSDGPADRQRGRRGLQRGEHARADRQGRRQRQHDQRRATSPSSCPTASSPHARRLRRCRSTW